MNSVRTYAQRVKLIGMLFIPLLVAAATLTVSHPAFSADVTATFSAHTEGSSKTIDHSGWVALLEEYVVAGEDGLNRVNYKAFKSAGLEALKNYIHQMEGVNPAELSRNEQFAFWANLYNAKTIDIILDHYPVKSIKNISLESGLFSVLKKSVGAGGPWKTPVLKVAGQKLSLNDIEHNILRPIFKDPRVHYAVNCASIGCPNLGRQPFTAELLEAQLDENARAYINHPRGVKVSGSSVTASSIYSWFKSDFGGNDSGVLAHLRKYANSDLKAKLKNVTAIKGYQYDWSLNDSLN